MSLPWQEWDGLQGPSQTVPGFCDSPGATLAASAQSWISVTVGVLFVPVPLPGLGFDLCGREPFAI